MQFVNIHGAPISVPTGKKPPPKPSGMKPDTYHKGWLVTGFSPEHLAAAATEHRNTSDKPWDEVAYMRNARPKKVRSKPYEVADGAEKCAAMARAAGWKLVQVSPVAKGGR